MSTPSIGRQIGAPVAARRRAPRSGALSKLTDLLRGQLLSPRALLIVAAALLAASIAAYIAISEGMHQPFYVGLRRLEYFDLRVYRGAALRIAHHAQLYGHPIVRHLGFTYPPVAALLFWPLSLISLKSDEILVTVLNLAALVFLLRRVLEIARMSLPRVGHVLARPSAAWTVAMLMAAASLWLEPVSVAVGYGQIDLLIVALVVFDISRPDSARSKGVGIGIAAGLKLTPLMFIPFLLCSRRPRAALIAALTFVATIAVSLIATPGDAIRYWGTLVFHSSRIGKAPAAGNQSLRGAIARLTGVLHPGDWTFLVIACVAVVGLVLATYASRRGNEPAGFSLCVITTLLSSPVSWTHHWVMAVPALLLLFLTAYERRSKVLMLCTAALIAVGYAYLPERTMHNHPMQLGGLRTLDSDPYVLIGLVVLLVAAAVTLRSRARERKLVPAA